MHSAIYVSSYRCICVLILLYMCAHTALYLASSYSYIRLLILTARRMRCMCPNIHTAIHVSSYRYICVLILLNTCSHPHSKTDALYVDTPGEAGGGRSRSERGGGGEAAGAVSEFVLGALSQHMRACTDDDRWGHTLTYHDVC